MENEAWINKISGLRNQDGVQNAMDQLIIDPPASWVALYSEAQAKAGEYNGRGEPIPQGLVEAIHRLAHTPSGFAGLTLHEYYVQIEIKGHK